MAVAPPGVLAEIGLTLVAKIGIIKKEPISLKKLVQGC
jgi:hypothetical protein